MESFSGHFNVDLIAQGDVLSLILAPNIYVGYAYFNQLGSNGNQKKRKKRLKMTNGFVKVLHIQSNKENE